MLNSIILMGRLVADPELRSTQTGIPVVSFTLAVDRDFADKQTGQRQTDFIDIVAWRQTAEFASRYFRKGQLVAAQGTLQTRKYEDKNGNKRTAFEVQADKLHFAEGKREGGGQGGGYQSPADYYSAQAPAAQPSLPEPSSFSSGSDDDFTPVPDDDLPF